MFLEQVDISGFKGINKLHLVLDDSTLLIGENAWGKSSLLDALTLLLSSSAPLYQFKVADFHHPMSINNGNSLLKIRVKFTFCELRFGSSQSERYTKLASAWVRGTDNLYRIHYEIEGELDVNGDLVTRRLFLSQQNVPLELESVDEIAGEIIRLNPVLRLSSRQADKCHEHLEQNPVQLSEHIAELSKQLAESNPEINKNEVAHSIQVMRFLLEYYFSNQKEAVIKKFGYQQNPSRLDWHALDNLNQIIHSPKNRHLRPLLLRVFATILNADETNLLDVESHPLLIVEEPESRLHPIMLSVAWGLLNNIPVQKLTTTNSGELLSLVPIERICRLVREQTRVAAYRLGDNPLSPEDYRRISFHIRFSRASSLFSRCWLLVEGETEIWMLNEFARLCGHHFDSEGIKIIEFAQSGLKPLIKFANRMGIEWHVLVDGDDAGKKYAATVRSYLRDDQEKYRLTILPAQDLESFMYREGFSQVYHRIAMLPDHIRQAPRRIIQKAIHRTSKPDLAIEVAEQAKLWGVESVPPLLRSIFSKVLKLARTRFEL